ncbi:50S ribosomal protein L9, apicoplast, putative [Plasmodium sp. DRC-Itaito]|nr:50S ribosomal protein L9, apicoplast, putative [Plasmodium sp. DRC-Itaito]
MHYAFFFLIYIFYIIFLLSCSRGFITPQIKSSSCVLYAIRKKKKKNPKLIHITLSSDNEIGKKGEVKQVKLSHAFNYIIPQRLGYRSTTDELVEKEKKDNTLKYIDDIRTSFIWTYKKKLNDLNILFHFKKDQKVAVTQDDLINYLLTRGLIRENDDVYEKIESKKIKLTDFGTYPIKYTFINNISINISIHIIKTG